MAKFMFTFLEIIWKMEKIRFRSKLRPPECTQIDNSDEDLLWDVANNSINCCSNDLKKLPDVVRSTHKRPLDFKKISIELFPVKKIPENHWMFGFLR